MLCAYRRDHTVTGKGFKTYMEVCAWQDGENSAYSLPYSLPTGLMKDQKTQQTYIKEPQCRYPDMTINTLWGSMMHVKFCVGHSILTKP